MRRAQHWPGSFESERDSNVTEFQHRRAATLILHKSSTVTPSLTVLYSNGMLYTKINYDSYTGLIYIAVEGRAVTHLGMYTSPPLFRIVVNQYGF